jgi:hypothetical protein
MANARNAILRRVNFAKVVAVDSDFSSAKFTGADVSFSVFACGDWTDSEFQHASMERMRWDGADFTDAILHPLGIGHRVYIDWQFGTLIGRFFAINRVQRPIREWLRDAENLCRMELCEDDPRLPVAIKRTIRALLDVNKARRLSYRQGAMV